MAIDLIPEDYRKRRDQIKLLRQMGRWLVAFLALLILTRVGLWGLLSYQQKMHNILIAGGKLREQRYGEAQALEGKRNTLKAALTKREELIRGPRTSELLNGLDNSFTTDVWLTDLVFTFRMTDKKGGAATPPQAKAITKLSDGQVDLRGSAKSYAAVYQFVEKLSTQPGITQVQVIETSINNKSGNGAVNFVAEAQLANATAKSKP
mgnify:FL=1